MPIKNSKARIEYVARLFLVRVYSTHHATQRIAGDGDNSDGEHSHSQDAEESVAVELEINSTETFNDVQCTCDSGTQGEDKRRIPTTSLDELGSVHESQEYDELIDEDYEEVVDGGISLGQCSFPTAENNHETKQAEQNVLLVGEGFSSPCD